MQKELTRLLQNQKGTYGVFVKDLNTGHTFGVNHLETFHAASTIKLPVNLYLYEQMAKGKVNPSIELVYRQEHYEDGGSKLQNDPVGSSYSIKQLSRYSIRYSDNIATNMLLSYLGYSNVKGYMASLGGKVIDYWDNTTCPRDMALYMSRLVKFTSQHPELGGQLMNDLENTIFNDRIPKLLPPRTKIAHKIGNWPPTGTFNDVALVKHIESPYIIAVFSKNTPGTDEAFQVIQKVSKIVYDHQDKLIEIDLTLNGRPLKTDVSPILSNGTVLVPVRIISESIDAKVRWDSEANRVMINKTGNSIWLQPGTTTATINGEDISLNTPPRIYNKRTMVPLRLVSKAMGARIKWDNDTKTVYITYS
ncbi:MAG: hypothetical protein FH756_07585 [Firmicutes bacterium]|nr:hypothetical protein [Bacillota bacterium]